jgi:predicted nucleic acid-binding protein
LSVYADTSFFVSIYLNDSHSKAADELARSGMRPSFTPLHAAEWTHAIAQQVFRGHLSAMDAHATYVDLERDLASALWRRLPFPEQALDRCANLARRHGPTFGIRTLDSLHVACALELKAERFWTFDERQAKLARAEGLKT